MIKLNSFSEKMNSLGPFRCTPLLESTIKLTHENDISKECYLLKSGLCVGFDLSPGDLSSLFKDSPIPEREIILPGHLSSFIANSADLDNRLAISKALDQLVEVEKLETSAESLIKKLECVLLEIPRHRLLWMNPSRSTLLQNAIAIHRLKLRLNQLQYSPSHGSQLIETCNESLGINVRLSALSARLTALNGLAEWQRQLVEHKHSLALEWGIILLIAGEIALTLVKMAVALE